MAALHQLLEEPNLRERGDRADDRPPDLRGALAELKRVGMLLPVPEGPQPCDLLEKRDLAQGRLQLYHFPRVSRLSLVVNLADAGTLPDG